MPSKVGVALATAGAYAAAQAFLAPGVTAPVTPSTGRHLRQATEASSAASCAGAGALAMGAAGVAVAANQKRVSRRCQVRRRCLFSWGSELVEL